MLLPRHHEDHSYIKSSTTTAVADEPVDAAVQVDMVSGVISLVLNMSH